MDLLIKMTRCNKNEVTLKSTAYNPTGQNYFEQLSAYNSMSAHLRRVLLAKSVIDARQKTYFRTRGRRSKLTECKPRFSEELIAGDVIDKLAYDSENHPADVLRMNLNLKYCCERNQKRANKRFDQQQSRICNGHVFYEGIEFHRSHPTSRTERSVCSSKQRCYTAINAETKSESKRNISRCYNEVICSALQRKCGRQEPIYVECPSPVSSPFGSTSGSPTREESGPSALSHPSEDNEDFDEEIARDKTSPKDEEAKYVKFVYDITREIMHNGLYTDKELQDVFRKHLEKNKDTLNISKMLYEIYQLKISLNMSDEDEELEDFMQAHQMSNLAEVRPPTPPKILNDNKVIEKLLSYQTLVQGRRKSSSSRRKSVTLIDANPELLVTERDVLLSLIEVDVDPQQAQRICKSLFHKSKDTSLIETVQVEAEVSYPKKDDLEINEEISRKIEELSERHSREVGSMTPDVKKQDEVVEAQERSSPESLLQDNYTEPTCAMFSRLCQARRIKDLTDKVIQTEQQIKTEKGIATTNRLKPRQQNETPRMKKNLLATQKTTKSPRETKKKTKLKTVSTVSDVSSVKSQQTQRTTIKKKKSDVSDRSRKKVTQRKPEPLRVELKEKATKSKVTKSKRVKDSKKSPRGAVICPSALSGDRKCAAFKTQPKDNVKHEGTEPRKILIPCPARMKDGCMVKCTEKAKESPPQKKEVKKHKTEESDEDDHPETLISKDTSIMIHTGQMYTIEDDQAQTIKQMEDAYDTDFTESDDYSDHVPEEIISSDNEIPTVVETSRIDEEKEISEEENISQAQEKEGNRAERAENKSRKNQSEKLTRYNVKFRQHKKKQSKRLSISSTEDEMLQIPSRHDKSQTSRSCDLACRVNSERCDETCNYARGGDCGSRRKIRKCLPKFPASEEADESSSMHSKDTVRS